MPQNYLKGLTKRDTRSSSFREGDNMKIAIDKSTLKQEEVDIQYLLSQISTGRAVLFTGAGFSKGTSTVDGTEPPVAKSLALEICRLS
jgi:hypothetical protein